MINGAFVFDCVAHVFNYSHDGLRSLLFGRHILGSTPRWLRSPTRQAMAS